MAASRRLGERQARGMIPRFERVAASNGGIIDDYALSVFEKRVVGVQANSRMGARICRDRYFGFFSLEMAIVVANVSCQPACTHTRIQAPSCPAASLRMTSSLSC